MSQELKLTAEMREAARKSCPDVPGDILDHALSAALAAAPVPPAGGEVEVLGYYVERGGANHFRDTQAEGRGTKCTALFDLAHVTRLQAELATAENACSITVEECRKLLAERDDLKAEVDRLDKEWGDEVAEHRITQVNRDRWRSNYHESQSELTKARELLGYTAGFAGPTVQELEQARAYLAHQSAPAAKGEVDE